jgi:hypothetical protein
MEKFIAVALTKNVHRSAGSSKFQIPIHEQAGGWFLMLGVSLRRARAPPRQVRFEL